MKIKKYDVDEKKILFPLLGVAFLLRLIFIIETTGTPFVSNLFSDSRIYMDYASLMVDSGDWIGNEPFFMAPVYPYMLALLKLIFGDSTYIVRLLQVLISTISILFIYLSAKNYFNKNVAFIAATIATFYDSYIFYSGIIFSETLQIFVFAVLIYMFSEKSKFSDKFHWLKIGLLFGLAALLRANILLFYPVLMLYIFTSKKEFSKYSINKVQLASFLSIGVVLIILPVTIRNVAVSGETVLITSNGGINFYIGNNAEAPGVFVTPKNFDFSSDMSGKYYASKLLGRTVTASEASAYWYDKSLDYLKKDPMGFVSLFGKKLMLFFDSEEFPQSSILDMDFYSKNYSKLLNLPLIPYSIIVISFIFGFLLLINYPKRDNILFLLILSYIISSALFFVNGRFRLGITPALIIISAFSINQIFEIVKLKQLKKIQAPLIVVGIFVVVSYFLINKPKYTDYDAYLQLGDIAQTQENYDQAVYYYNRSIVLDDRYLTFINLGNTFAKKRDYKNALSAFAEAEKRNDKDYLLFFNRGIVYSQVGDYNKALESYEKALELKPEFSPVFRNIGIIYFVSEKYADAKYYFNKFLQVSKDEQTNALVRQDLQTIEKRLNGEN